ncbi:MAG: hypothetical protein MJ211_11860 [Bacteroidales bacterium]|nr:hypothetical protein [Bacteroidales bacterium]
MKKTFLLLATMLISGYSIAQDLESQIKSIKPLVIEAPTNFAGKELPINNAKKITLKTISRTSNNITDDDEWIYKHAEGMPYQKSWYGENIAETDFDKFLNVPLKFENLYRGNFEEHNDYCIVTYGENKFNREIGYDCNVVVIFNKELSEIKAILDFREVVKAFIKFVDPSTPEEDYFTNFICPTFRGYTEDGDIFYISMSHNTYSSSSKGYNSYLLAIEKATGKIKWMTKPLTCNSQFVVIDNSIVCGYGFSGEKHYMYVVDKNTGRRSQTLLVLKTPELISIEGKNLFVRTYSYDYKFAF